ncbi:polysaccharide deacetylase family protein [Qipengyuania sp. JC766]|uniref:polysaccharide deacetylase family protein n=1 Tax=Qipengyuania sp. JC766 TaxID=3232139 RepID=UPI00345B23B8
MTTVYITVDTEYSSGMANGPCPAERAENYARSIACITQDGPSGLTYKLQRLEEYGQKAVFFVDPMPALVWGVAAIEDIVAPILNAGQDVQLHCHTEWLGIAGADNPFGVTGDHIKDFALEDQCRILEWARDTLVAAGARMPVAFRAGNYGANDDTLRALRQIGIRYDSSHTPGIIDGHCAISLGPDDRQAMLHKGIVEVPAGCIATIGGGLRHAQICALSLREMTDAIRHARNEGLPCFTLVSHSFELVNRRTLQPNKIIRARFDGLCRSLQAMRGVRTGTYHDDPPLPDPSKHSTEPLPADAWRSSVRVAEQLVSNTLYGAL